MSDYRSTITFRQAKARADADRIINGKQTPHVGQLYEIITTLQGTGNLSRQMTDGDFWRVRRLREMRDKKISELSQTQEKKPSA